MYTVHLCSPSLSALLHMIFCLVLSVWVKQKKGKGLLGPGRLEPAPLRAGNFNKSLVENSKRADRRREWKKLSITARVRTCDPMINSPMQYHRANDCSCRYRLKSLLFMQ